jgi:hypothetical protein
VGARLLGRHSPGAGREPRARAVYIELVKKRRLRALQEPLWARGVAVAVRLFRDSRGQTFYDRILSIVRTREPVLYAVECAA